MDQKASVFKNDSRSSVVTRLDRLNDKVTNLINKNKHLQKDSQVSDDLQPGFLPCEKGDLDYYLAPDDRDLDDDSFLCNPFFQRWSELSMKLEDLRSAAMKTSETLNLTEPPSSLVSEAASVLHGEEVHIKELYRLEKQVKNIISQVESGETFSGRLKFCNVTFYFHVLGLEFPAKDKLAKIIFPEEFRWNRQKERMDQEILELRKNVAVSKNFMQRFALGLETEMKKRFFELSSAGFKGSVEKNRNSFENFKPHKEKTLDKEIRSLNRIDMDKDQFCQGSHSKVYIENVQNDWKSWENFRNMKKIYKKCEFNCRALEWQNAETQVMNNHLRSKLKNVLKQEGELNFRSQDMFRLNVQYQESLRALQEREKKLAADQAQFEESKKKLERMKSVINDKIDEINKSIDFKPTTYTSRATDLSPTLKVTKNSSCQSSSSSDSFQNFELSGDSQEEPNRSSKQSKASSLKVSQSLRSSPKTSEKSFCSRKTQNFKSIKDVQKPPIYRRSLKLQNDCSNLAYTKSLLMREERVAEKEAEIARREKEIHDQWVRHPYSQEFIPMIQKEMIRLKELQECYSNKIALIDQKLQDEDNFDSSLMSAKSAESDEDLSHHSKLAKDVYSMMEEYFY